jgi:Fe-S cluster assembly protein SufD
MVGYLKLSEKQMKERAENNVTSLTWLADAFAHQPQHFEGDVQRYKQQQLARIIARGFPSRREEAWKYTDVSFLEKSTFDWPADYKSLSPVVNELIRVRSQDNILFVFINGQFAPEFSSVPELPGGIIANSLRQAVKTQGSLLAPFLFKDIDSKNYPFACLNAAMLSDGLFLYVPLSIELEKPVHILSIAAGQPQCMAHPRHIVILENNSKITLTEEYIADEVDQYLVNAAVDFYVGNNAKLDYYKILKEAGKSKHLSNIFFHQKQNSSVNAYSFSLDGGLARHDLTFQLMEPGAECAVKGFYDLHQDQQLTDHHIIIEHAAPHTKSDMDFRGVAAKQSRGVFNGKVKVLAQAKKTQAHQVNHNLVLSPLAEINTKPDLEVYADDVQCSHGATVGQLDEEALFYLCSRGIAAAEAATILLQGFIEQVLSGVKLPWLIAEIRGRRA